MSHLQVKKVEDNMKFKWGRKKGVSQTDERIQFYESFTYEDVEYFVCDCAYIYCKGDTETSICKLVKMFETPTHVKRVKVVRFRRPIEIRDILGNHNPQWNELFLASGQGVGRQDYINPVVNHTSFMSSNFFLLWNFSDEFSWALYKKKGSYGIIIHIL